MAYQFADGFDNYTTITQIWDSLSGSCTMTSAAARFPGLGGTTSQGIRLSQNGNIIKTLLSSQATLIAGVAYLAPSFSLSANQIVCSLLDTGTQQVTLGYSPAGVFQFYRGSISGTAIGSPSASGLITPNSWHYIEIVVTIDPSAGAVALFLDQPSSGGTAAINSTGLNTRATANSSANMLQLKDNNIAANIQWDDVYVFDSTGGANNARTGDQRIVTKMPNGVGNSTQWTPNGAGANWQCVDEIPPDDDTTYVSSSTAGQTDLYTTQSAGLSSSAPNFVVVRRRHRKDDVGAHTDQSIIRSVSTNASSTAVAVPSSYVYQDDLFINDPNTGSPWASGTAADAIQIGVVETS